MISDAELRIAATEAAKALVAAAEALEDDGQPLPTPKWERRLPLWEIQQSFRRAAAAVLVLLLGCGSWLTLDAEAQKRFFGWIREEHEYHVTYKPEESTKAEYSGKREHYRLGWIPEGYTEVRRTKWENMDLTTYVDRDGRYLSFDYSWGENTSLLITDTDRMSLSYVKVRGVPGDLWTSEYPDISPCLVWTDENGVNFFLSGFLEVDELLRLAESIEIQ